jgi:putative transposase
MGAARWWWNYALNLSNETYKETGKVLPKLKKSEETAWLGECYSQVLQSTTLYLTKAFKNFFEKRAKYPRFKSYQGKQSVQYPQNCLVLDRGIKIPQIGIVKAAISRLFEGDLKTVTVTKTPTRKYYASLLYDTKQEFPEITVTGKVIGVDLGIKDFAITNDGIKTSKYNNPKHLKKHEKNLARKQAKLARKKKGSKSRERARLLVSRVHERISNARQDFLHKLSRKIVNDNQVVVVESLNIKGMLRMRSLAKARSDVGWGTFINFLGSHK